MKKKKKMDTKKSHSLSGLVDEDYSGSSDDNDSSDEKYRDRLHFQNHQQRVKKVRDVSLSILRLEADLYSAPMLTKANSKKKDQNESYTEYGYCKMKPDGCRASYRFDTDSNDGTFSLSFSKVKHTRHAKFTNETGVPRYFKILMDAMARHWINTSATPSIIVSYFEHLCGGKDGLRATISSRMVKAIKRRWTRISTNLKHTHLKEKGDAIRYAGMIQTFELYKKKNIKNFNRHTVYLIGDKYIADNKDKNNQVLVGVLSSEEALLNMPRSQFEPSSDGAVVTIDTMWRIDKNGYGLIVVGTPDRSQSHHNICYCYCNRDGGVAHNFALTVLKKEVKALVERRVALDGGFY